MTFNLYSVHNLKDHINDDISLKIFMLNKTQKINYIYI